MNNRVLYMQMKAELRSISMLNACKISRYVLMAVLAAFFTYKISDGTFITAPFYILLAALLLPAGLSAFFYNARKTASYKYYFPELCKKYGFTYFKKQDYSNTMLILYLFLVLWQKFPSENLENSFEINFPALLLSFIVIIRLLCFAVYTVILRKQLLTPTE